MNNKKIAYYILFILNTFSVYTWSAGEEKFEGYFLRGSFSPIPPVSGDPYRRNIAEFIGGDRFVKVSTSGFRTLSRGPLPYNIVLGSRGTGRVNWTPVSEVWSKWSSETISNQSIFPYLLDSRRGEPLSDFVRGWYKSSCALVYYSGSGDSKLIGTGAYVEGSSWTGFGRGEGIIATARHNFEGIPLRYLYARFFNYRVVPVEGHSSWLRVYESFIDVPVIAAQTAQGGLDAGVLRLLSIPRGYRKKYTRMISPSMGGYEDDWKTIPPGRYAMFHFAGTRHLVSVGHVYSPPRGTWLNSDVRIEAGPGASGAAILQQVGGHVSSEGISVYRHMDDFGVGRSVQRRIIPYARFGRKGILNDRVTAPYRHNRSFRVIPPVALEEDGYEFLRWRTEKHVARRKGMDARGRVISLFNHPRHDAYRLVDPATMSNHHIIPIDHLLYLWEYVFDDRLETSTIDLIKRQTLSRFRKGTPRRIVNAELQRQIRRELDIRYGRLKELLEGLSPEGIVNKTGFAWAWWNLFKGPKESYRDDDPSKDGTYDFSEKRRPLRFNLRLWESVQALNRAIIKLVTTSKNLTSSIRDIVYVEGEVQKFEEVLLRLWSRTREKRVHPYHADEWFKTGRSAGSGGAKHPLYQLKRS